MGDLAALNKAEYLLWDSRGLKRRQPRPAPDELALLDKAAEVTQADDSGFAEMRAIYQHRLLKAPRKFMTYSPARPFYETIIK